METLQALPAGLRFGRFLQREIDAGRIGVPGSADVLRGEMAQLEQMSQ